MLCHSQTEKTSRTQCGSVQPRATISLKFRLFADLVSKRVSLTLVGQQGYYLVTTGINRDDNDGY